MASGPAVPADETVAVPPSLSTTATLSPLAADRPSALPLLTVPLPPPRGISPIGCASCALTTLIVVAETARHSAALKSFHFKILIWHLHSLSSSLGSWANPPSLAFLRSIP